MKKMWKKTPLFLISLSMIITMISAVAWADNACTHVHDEYCGYRAEIIERFDISQGSITVTAGTDGNEGKVVFTQGSKIVTVNPDTPVEITGSYSLTGGSAITIKNCSPTIVLNNLNITCAPGNYKKCIARSTILVDGTTDDTVNLILSGTNTLNRTVEGDGNHNNSCGIEIKEATLIIGCIDHKPGNCTDAECSNKLIVKMTPNGGGRGAGIGSGRDKEGLTVQPDGFTLILNGGYIDVLAGSAGAAIGVGDTSAVSGEFTNKVTISIHDGYVKASAGSVAIGGSGKSLSAGVVTVNVTGGTVNGMKLPVGMGTATIPAGMVSEVTTNADGSVNLPAGTVIQNTEGTITTLPDGGSVAEGGAVISTGTVTITKGNEVITITSEEGKVVVVNPDGTMTLPAGSIVAKADGTKVSLPNGGQITSSGEVIVTPGTDSGDDGSKEEIIPSRRSTSNGSSSKKYSVSIDTDDIENGSVKVSSSRVKKGSTVTTTVTPDEGYELDRLVVLDDDGEEVELTDKGNGKFTFKMPRGGVKIEASFKESEDTSVMEEPLVSDDKKTIVLTIDSKMISIDGEFVVNDVAPIIIGDRTVLPIRVIAEALGATVTWNGTEQAVTIVKDDINIVIYIGQVFTLVNGNPIQLDAPAFIENDRTYLPLHFIMENLGASVVWDGLTRTVTIIG